jgi:hypothetical protein
VDKISTAMLAFVIVQGLSKRLVARFPRPENAEAESGNSTTQIIIALVVVVIVVALGFVVRNMLG